jgi:hypothetical protein
VPRVLARVLIAVAVGAGAWAATAGAGGPPRPLDTPLSADLDGDGSAELVIAHEVQCFTNAGVKPPPCEKDGLRSLTVQVTGGCGQAESGPGFGGQPLRILTLSREMDFVSFARIVDADGDGQARELAFELRAGATGRGVQAKVVSFTAGADGCVAVRRTLFSYPRPDSIGRRPKGTSFAGGALTVHDFVKHFPGQELRTTETYARPVDAGCCPSFQRVTYWRLDAARDAYAPYRTKLTKLRASTIGPKS